MKVYDTIYEYIDEVGYENYKNININFYKKYAGYGISGNEEAGFFILYIRGEIVAVIDDATLKDVWNYIRERSDNIPIYYWLDTDYHHVIFNEKKFALIRGELDINGKKDRETEEVICVGRYDELDDEDCLNEFDAIDKYIEESLGFLPEYSVN